MPCTLFDRSTTSTSPCSGCEWASPKCSFQYPDSKSESSNQTYGLGTSIVDGYTRSQSLVLAINDPEADISYLSESDQVVVQSCWKEWALPDEIGTGKSLRERSESALALLQAACLGRAGQNRTLPETLLPWVEVVGTDHMWRLLNCKKGSEAGVMGRTEVLCSQIVGSVL